MKKAIICFPKINEYRWEQAQFPIGLYKIKAYCKEKYDIKVLDERLESNISNEIDKLLDDEVLCLGLSVMTGEQINSAIQLSRKYHGRVKIVWGGVHPTILPKNTICEDFIDYVIQGDGEVSFLNLLEFLDKGKVQNELFLSKNNENFNINYLDDLNKSNIDFQTEIIRDEYFVKRDGFNKAFTIETSRGCPHSCAFCHNTILGHRYQTVETDYVINCIKYLYIKYNIDGVIFQEDNFFGDVNRVRKIVDELERMNYIGWKANSRLSYFEKLSEDEKIMNKLVESHCKVLQFGIESGSDRILKLINKKISVRDVLLINKKLAKYSIRIRYNFIIGFPTETVDEIRMTMELVQQLIDDNPNLENPFINIYTPYPGTPIFDLAVKQGFLPPSSLEEWAKISWNEANYTIRDENVRNEIYCISNKFLKESNYLR